MLTFDNPRPRTAANIRGVGTPSEPVLAQILAVGKDESWLQGKIICYFSSVQQGLDSRAFHMECVPLAERGLHMQLIAAHGVTGQANGVELVSFPASKKRIFRMLFGPLILLLAVEKGADVYKFTDPELLPIGLLLKLWFRKRVVYDAREDFPLMMLTKPWIPRVLRPLVRRSISVMEHLAARALDGIVTADPSTLRRLAREGKSKKLVFFNFPNLDFFPEPQPGPKLFDVVYRGGLSERTGTLILLEAVRRLVEQGRRQTRLLLIGYYDDARSGEDFIRERIRSLGLQANVELRGWVEHQKMAEAFSQARIGVCPLQPIPKFMHNIPVKVWEYWACGLPVIASDLPPIRPFFRNPDFGLLVKPDDPEQLAAAIRWLLEHPGEATKMGHRGRRAVVERYNNRNEIKKLLSFYQRVLTR